MKNIFPLLVVILVLLVDVKQARVLPSAIGSGYDLFRGDPFVGQIDPGFKDFNVFNLPTSSRTTGDGIYSITDYVQERDLSSCKFQANTNKISSTQSYADSLSNTVSFGVEFNVGFVGGAFSTSTSWRNAEQTTNVEDSSIFISNAQCQCYSLSLSRFLFSTNLLSQNFKAAVAYCAKNHDWLPFIQMYGTHFPWKVVLGGRITRKTVVQNTEVGKITSTGLDLSNSASVSFMSAGGFGVGYDMSTASDESKYTMAYKKSSDTYFLGGQPTDGYDEVIWAKNVRNDTMPIKYQLYDHSLLFPYVPAIAGNYSAVRTEFFAGVDKYCADIGCKKQPQPDKPIPLKYKFQLLKGLFFGGDGVKPFDMVCPLVTMKIIGIKAYDDGRCMRGLQILCGDRVKRQIYTYGQVMGYKLTNFDLPDGHQIAYIDMRTSDSVFYMKITTDLGSYVELGASGGGFTRPRITVRKGYRVVGMYGQADGDIKKLGFIYGKAVPVLNTAHMSTLTSYLTSHNKADKTEVKNTADTLIHQDRKKSKKGFILERLS